MKLILKQMRPLHWTKNLLIFVPMIFSHEISLPLIREALLGFFAWGFLASFVYILNDVVDIRQDKFHPEKSKRPIASGNLKKEAYLPLAMFCFVMALVLSMFVGISIQLFMISYLFLNIAYTFKLKKLSWFDLLFLTSFYLLRVLSGVQFIHSPVTSWFLVACVFLFLGLSSAKREKDLEGTLKGRGYCEQDKTKLLFVTKISWALLGILLCLYPYSENAKHLYKRPWIIPLSSVTLIVLYNFIHRRHREFIDELLKSWILYLLLFIVGLVFYLAI
jgi:4-hydroxybenzoate polyprenyltransferase